MSAAPAAACRLCSSCFAVLIRCVPLANGLLAQAYLGKLLPHEPFWRMLNDDADARKLSGTYFLQRVVDSNSRAGDDSANAHANSSAAEQKRSSPPHQQQQSELGLAPVTLGTRDGHHLQLRFSLLIKMVNKGQQPCVSCYMKCFIRCVLHWSLIGCRQTQWSSVVSRVLHAFLQPRLQPKVRFFA